MKAAEGSDGPLSWPNPAFRWIYQDSPFEDGNIACADTVSGNTAGSGSILGGVCTAAMPPPRG